MSCKEIIEAYSKITAEEIQMMEDLYMNGINRDGHSWVTYGDVERVVGKIILGRTKGEQAK